ncbi:Zinc finger, U1-type [Melia azedarach]|nr:Zinc finger, U1-type [Melia azedarach]
MSAGQSPDSSPNPSLSGMQRQKTVSGAECPSSQLPQPFYSNPVHANQTDDIVCTICNVPCSSAYNYKQHIDGRKHKAKLEELKFDGKLANKQRWCQVCKVWCMDDILFKMHLNGKKHKGELQKARCRSKDSGEIAKQQKWCSVCQVWCMDNTSFKMHLNGKKHKGELQKARYGSKGSGEIAKEEKWCELCDLWCPNEEAFKLHLDGKIHALRLHDNQKKRRVENLGSCSGKPDQKEWKSKMLSWSFNQ